MYWVYAIRSSKSNRLYIGQTNHVTRRIEEHNKGLVKSTQNDKPWQLIAVETFQARNEARWTERILKKSKGKRDKWLRAHKIASDKDVKYRIL